MRAQILLVPLLLALPTALADAREESATYAWAPLWADAAFPVAGLHSVCDANLGGACFAIQPGDARVAFAIEDARGVVVEGAVEFLDAAGEPAGEWSFCGAGESAVPPGAARAVVHVGFACESAGPATRGTIVAAFSG